MEAWSHLGMPQIRYTDLWGKQGFSLSWELCYTQVVISAKLHSSFWPFQLFLPICLKHNSWKQVWVYNCIVTTEKTETIWGAFPKDTYLELDLKKFPFLGWGLSTWSWKTLQTILLKPLWRRSVSLKPYLGFFPEETMQMIPDFPWFDLELWLYNGVKGICLQKKLYFELWILTFS